MTRLDKHERSSLFRSPGLFVRLGGLIVIQSSFVFAALGFILFQSDENTSQANENRITRYWLSDMGQQVADRCLAISQGSLPSDFRAIETASGRGDTLASAGLIAVRSDGSLKCIASIDPAGSLVVTGAEPLIAGHIDESLVRMASQQPAGFALSSIEDASQSIFYGNPEIQLGDPVVFVASVNHRYIITERASLTYIVFLLFLASTLVSLLIAYLMFKKIKEPLTRLSEGLEKTSEGVPCNQDPTCDEGELAGLADSANKIALTLREQQDEIRDYGNMLEAAHSDLANSERFLGTLIDSSPSCVLATSSSGHIILYNREAQRSFGFSPEQALGSDVREIISLSNDWPSANDLPARMQCEVICRRNDQTQFPAFVIAAPIVDPEGVTTAVLYILRDISESRGFQEMMVRLDRYSTRGEMAGEIAHEINNYLAVLSGNIELMPLLMKKGDQEKIFKKLEMMRTTCDKIAKFTDGLMDGSSEEAAFYPHNVNQIIENVLAFLKPQNKFDRVEFKREMDSDLPHVLVDAGQIQQLLVNLINNAADALAEKKEGGVCIVQSFRGMTDDAPCVKLIIQDNGPGVVPDKIDRLFVQRFTTKKRGHGIGLITCKKIIDSHGGAIAYGFDNGAVFSVTLPVAVNSDSQSESAGKTGSPEVAQV